MRLLKTGGNRLTGESTAWRGLTGLAWSALLVCGCVTEGAPPPRDRDAIAQVVARIDSTLSSMTMDSAIVLELSTEGAQIDVHREGGSLRRIRAEYLGETGRATDLFYFDPELIFASRTGERYDLPLSGRVVSSAT